MEKLKKGDRFIVFRETDDVGHNTIHPIGTTGTILNIDDVHVPACCYVVEFDKPYTTDTNWVVVGCIKCIRKAPQFDIKTQ